MKLDLSERSHDQKPPSNPIPLRDRLSIPLSGFSAEFAHKYGSPQELSDLRAAGAILLGSSALSSLTTTVGLHLAMGGGGFHASYAVAGLFVGGLTGAIDYVVQYKGTLSSRGNAELRRVGLKLPDPEGTSRIPFLVRLVRVGQAATFGFLAGTFLIIGTNFSDVQSYIDNKYMTSNQTVAADASKLVDAGIARSKQALSVQDAEVNNISRSLQALRSNDVRRAIGRKTNAPSSTSDPQLEGLERRLAEATAKRDALAATVTAQESGRNAGIEKAINESPNAIRKRSGLAAQLEALSALTSENPRLWLLVLAFEFLSLALELGPMWAAATKLPSALAARLAREHYVAVSTIAKEAAEQLEATDAERRDVGEAVEPQAIDVVLPAVSTAVQSAANDNVPESSLSNDVAVPRRGRGRPRGSRNKTHFNGHQGDAGYEQ
ncbi:DUF4407 domain-containing protein [Bradyrhizobium iriomotense]|uniref:RDD domain-containing protein n=1 Tax=Bradyrhizobium iriomotense TaxID=441950 RepID=A0ABQ6B7L0_9BRAD|nr:DUF4407 domain-containing protein [Bradyrhizobium iriomotense]GLR89763.1 hypothetical protein GCM10007857_64770 [Bradyrhizobium iriomotense]